MAGPVQRWKRRSFSLMAPWLIRPAEALYFAAADLGFDAALALAGREARRVFRRNSGFSAAAAIKRGNRASASWRFRFSWPHCLILDR